MIRSMTGFGEASAQIDGVHYFVEIRSLNNKYFKGVIRLSESLQSLEAELESLLRQRLTRGTITLLASCNDSSASAAHTVNSAALSRYIEQLRAIPEVAGGEVRLDVAALLGLPGVLQPPADEEDRLLRARKAFTQVLNRACDGLLAMREREGAMLVTELLGQSQYIRERLDKIRERCPSVVADYEQRLKSRIEVLLQGHDVRVDAVDLIREIAVYAERTDIAEEVARLTGHLEQFGQMLTATEDRPVGRTLDFLSQEMLREANTIASKSPDADTSRLIVEIKGAIDRIKEQAQNVE
ncbi:MAG: YicC family protein [Phycisphaeraceae bacterium]|nr:YicC family protein [Phycisphaerae bacterium]MBX3392727.1 YicC family protein [Phycisphaeraceae bacterium]HRJ49784.1 YicC family protein [Phycisphaerales bacterium]